MAITVPLVTAYKQAIGTDSDGGGGMEALEETYLIEAEWKVSLFYLRH